MWWKCCGRLRAEIKGGGRLIYCDALGGKVDGGLRYCNVIVAKVMIG